MPQNYFKPLITIILMLLCTSTYSQYVFHNKPFPGEITLHRQTTIADVGQRSLEIHYVLNHYKLLHPRKLKSQVENLGFTKDNFWAKVELKNLTNTTLHYYLETAGPMMNLAELYYSNKTTGKITKIKSGYSIPFQNLSIENRKTIFKINLLPHSTTKIILHLKSTGDAIKMRIILHTTENLIKMISKEQFLFGLFYGVLATTAILFLFFYFALKERTFILYSLYLIFIGMMQFSIDGFFYQLIAPNGGWITQHVSLIFAIVALFLLGKYSEAFLNIKRLNKGMFFQFKIAYCLLFLLILCVLFVPSILKTCYQLSNIVGLYILTLITISVIKLHNKKMPVDIFYSIGIVFLSLGFTTFILDNFGYMPDSFFTQNSGKIGTGLEVIFLSLSMANLIRKLKKDKNELTTKSLARLEEIDELKSHFLSNISHELRTPLNAIFNLTDSILKENNNRETEDKCKIIMCSSQSLLSSINDILDYSKIEKGELIIEESDFTLENALNNIKNSAKIQAKNKNLDFEYLTSDNLPHTCIGDANRLEQILKNIINNAIKFTPQGKIKFQIEGKKKAENKITLTFTITDTGIGISNEKLNSIFDSFTQNTINTKRKFGGLGLGLYIAKKLIDKQNGTIQFASKIGQGTICTISLDYLIAFKQKQEIITNQFFDLKGKNILVVEDDAINQMVVKMITKNWLNTTVAFANNGKEGLEQLKNNLFDIILMDLQMPVMDGYEAIIAIRNGEVGHFNANIPIIAVTADVMEVTKRRVKEIGINHYLSKPLNNKTLFQAIENYARK